MRIDEILVVILRQLADINGIIEGKTLLQKVVYFVNEKLGLNLRFVPYYYGPYSEEVTMAIEEMIGVGMIKEDVETYPSTPWLKQFEPKLYRYELNEFGLKFADIVKKEHLEQATQIENVINEIRQVFQNNVKLLSVAGKMFNILKLKGKPMTADDILNEAKILGWKISKADAEEAILALEKIGLIEKQHKTN